MASHLRQVEDVFAHELLPAGLPDRTRQNSGQITVLVVAEAMSDKGRRQAVEGYASRVKTADEVKKFGFPSQSR